MRPTSTLSTLLALVSLCAGIEPHVTHAVNVIQKMTQDLNSSPSGHKFYHHSDNIHPGGYKADVNHGAANTGSQLDAKHMPKINSHGKSGTYKVAGGYGFMISHDYGTREGHVESPRADAHYGGTSVHFPSITLLKLESEKLSGGPKIQVHKNVETVRPGGSEGLDSYIGKEIYGTYMEYDKLVKDDKPELSDAAPAGKYYGSDSDEKKEKYYSDGGYNVESNNDRDKGRYVESEKYDGSQNYKGNENYGKLEGNSDYFDDAEAEKYFTHGEYGRAENVNDMEKAELYQGYEDTENNHETFEPYETYDEFDHNTADYRVPSSMYLNFGEYKSSPEFTEARNSFLDDFFKEYKHFSERHNEHGFENDHAHDDEYHDDHDFHNDKSMYAEHGNSDKGFFDEADFKGDHYEEGDGSKGSSFGEKKGHKKGSKTTGYRNVLHKDEFNKDHTFYEHAKKMGDFDKSGNEDEHDSQIEEGHKKYGHNDYSSHDDYHGKSDSHDKGYIFDDDVSDHDEHGYKTYYDDNSCYNDAGDGEYESEHGEGFEH